MGKYRLITLDMDGTLLNSEKEISERTNAMIRRAAEEGKIIALSTGRGLSELSEYLEQVPEIGYLDCTSGAMIYDCREKKVVVSTPIPVDVMQKVMALAEEENVMVHFLSTDSVVEQSKYEQMEKYHMGVYKPMYGRVAKKCENIFRAYEENPKPIEKCNLYHLSPAKRDQTERRLEDMHLPLTIVHSELTALELTSEGVSKGTGLLQLCEYLGIPVQETIAVGDADNDIEVLKTAGLAIAMGNAAEHVKAIADVMVADCDHDGCAEAIGKYLLGDAPVSVRQG